MIGPLSSHSTTWLRRNLAPFDFETRDLRMIPRFGRLSWLFVPPSSGTVCVCVCERETCVYAGACFVGIVVMT